MLKRKRSDSVVSEPQGESESSGSQTQAELELGNQDFTILIKPIQPLRRAKGKKRVLQVEPKTEGFQLDVKDKILLRPQKKWESLKFFSKFIVQDHSFTRGSIVEVKRPGLATEDRKEWIARVLEIRAQDEAHVYIRIAWFYWPEDLPMGRQPYHGVNEAIESNHPDIIDAMTVNGIVECTEWDEDDEDAEMGGYFYRQTFDYLTKQLSAPKQICVCEGPYNPDTSIWHCPDCDLWLHEGCITANAVARHQKPLPVSNFAEKLKSGMGKMLSKGKKGKAASKTASSSKPEQTVAAVTFKGKLRIREKGRKGDGDSDSGVDADTIIDEDVKCLRCDKVIS